MLVLTVAGSVVALVSATLFFVCVFLNSFSVCSKPSLSLYFP